jgi:hypothetical protein
MAMSEHLEKASGDLKALSERASVAEANVKAAAEKEVEELREQVDAVGSARTWRRPGRTTTRARIAPGRPAEQPAAT